MRVKDNLVKLKQVDIYSLMLFALFKLSDIPEYASLSRLAYILDKDSLLSLCEYFGGMTLKIPTIDELESIVYSLVLYQHVNVDNMLYEDAVKTLGCDSSELRKVKSNYLKIVDILDKYSFNTSNEE